MTRTIPKVRKRMNKTPPPMFEELVRDLNFDPGAPFLVEDFQPWGLDEAYPPTVGEMIGALSVTENEGTQGEGQSEGADDAGGGSGTVSGGPEDGGPMGDTGEADLDQDAGGASPVPDC